MKTLFLLTLKVHIHVLNVGIGDCIIFQTSSGRVSMFDICGGNIEEKEEKTVEEIIDQSIVKGNFQMCKHPHNPINFLTAKLNKKKLFRFILSHPDMDHMDGFNYLFSKVPVSNFWDSGVRKGKPDFSKGPYLEADWDRYEKVRDEKENGITVINPLAGAENKYFNKDDEGGNGDYIYMLLMQISLMKPIILKILKQ